MRITEIRLKNFRHLVKEAGGICIVAKRLNVSQSRISHLVGHKPYKNIGNKMASRIEQTFHKPYGWLDESHDIEEIMTDKDGLQGNQIYQLLQIIVDEATHKIIEKLNVIHDELKQLARR